MAVGGRARPRSGSPPSRSTAYAAVGSVPVAAARLPLYGQCAEQLAAAAGPAGLLVVLEDLHWADEMFVAACCGRIAGEISGSDSCSS